jgi:RNA polymerase sigma-70 factor (ECF subfamily)
MTGMDEFEAIYARYYRDVYRFALFLTSDHARAEDLAAETFVRAWGALGRVRQPTMKAYLLTITRNLFRDSRRRERSVPLDESMPIAGPSLEAQVERFSTLRGIRARLRSVASGDRRALLMFVVREMSYEEIARVLGISVGAVKSRIFRAREALEHLR